MLTLTDHDNRTWTVVADTADEFAAFLVAAERARLNRTFGDTGDRRWKSVQLNRRETAILQDLVAQTNRPAAPAPVETAPAGRGWIARRVERALSAVATPRTIEQDGRTLTLSGYGRPWIYPADGTGDSELEGQEVRYVYYR